MQRPTHRSEAVTLVAAAAAIAVGVLVHIGFQFDIRFLTQPMADASSMRATTATLFICVGVSLWLFSVNRFPRVAVLLGVVVGIAGVLSLGHVAFGQDFPIDRLWLIDDDLGRMSPFTAVCFAALGSSLALAGVPGRAWIVHALALTTALVATVVIIGYFYKVSDLIGVGLYVTMAPHTAVLMLAAAAGTLCLKPHEGVMRVLLADTLGGMMARRTLPATIGIPIVLGWFRLAGERAGLYDARIGPPLVIVGSMVIVSIVIWINAKLIDQVDAKRQAAEAELRRSNEVLEVRIREKITEARVAEQQLRAGQRLEAMGQLAGGVAHDFNNMMTVVSGYSELLMGQIPSEHPFRRGLEEIKKAGDRCTKLTGHLLAFSRRQVLAPAVLDLNAVIADVSTMLPVLVGDDISVKTTPGTDLWSVRADPAQIEQVIVNLAVNARDAMPRGGTLTISTANVSADRSVESGHHELPAGPYVLLRIADTGHGMDDETKARAFDPFFTTKPVGQGTGFGLSTAYGVITQSGGHIFVDSQPGAGATFRIYLPRVTAPLTPALSVLEKSASSGQETVLLVEDEEALRRFLCDVLEAAGYCVLGAAGAGEAIAMAEEHSAPIDLLLTDVVMPGLSGGELAEHFRHRRPETAVLFMSGYAHDVVVQHAVSTADAMFLQKPFSADTLLAKVRDVLDGPYRPGYVP